MFESNYFTMLMKPNYEKPVDSAEDVIDRRLAVISAPGAESVVETFKNSPYYITRTLAERTIVPEVIFYIIFSIYYFNENSSKDWDKSDEMVKNRILKSGSAVIECSFLYDYELDWAKEYNTRWYRSKEKKGGYNPFPSFMMNKKWTLEEEFNNHMLRFQQVTVSSSYFSKLYFYIPGWIDSH